MAQSGWSLSLDVWSARFLAWAASWGRDAELTPEAHAYFYDRYSRLAAHHRVRGRLRRAARLELKAREHYRPDNPGPPYAAAMAMPRPTRFIPTTAISGSGPDDDAA
jgi:hypothetical protein